jgi:hypothetical protein
VTQIRLETPSRLTDRTRRDNIRSNVSPFSLFCAVNLTDKTAILRDLLSESNRLLDFVYFLVKSRSFFIEPCAAVGPVNTFRASSFHSLRVNPRRGRLLHLFSSQLDFAGEWHIDRRWILGLAEHQAKSGAFADGSFGVLKDLCSIT